jgi:hypothetical protein
VAALLPKEEGDAARLLGFGGTAIIQKSSMITLEPLEESE